MAIKELRWPGATLPALIPQRAFRERVVREIILGSSLKKCKRGHFRMGVCAVCHRQSRDAWEQKNKKKSTEQHLARRKRWTLNHPGWRKRYRNPSYRAAERQAYKRRCRVATPPWVSIADLMIVYDKAKRLTTLTGIQHDVDHIYPLRGTNSCGLHVPWNLQVLTKEENVRKGNSDPSSRT